MKLGRVSFGLKMGELRLQLKNVKMPRSTIRLVNLFDVSLEQQSQQATGTERLGTLGLTSAISNKDTSTRSTGYRSTTWQVRFKGGPEESPTWIFEAKSDIILQGMLQDRELGTFEPLGKSFAIYAEFWLPQSSIQLRQEDFLEVLGGTGGWQMNQWQDFLDRADRILQAPTDDFLKLAVMMGRDPLKDYAGADLENVNLRGAKLATADFHQANLRRSTLRDCDLREANLSGADLSEADLSGADLSGADLSGADLSEAKLSDANLNGTNLSSADVTNTILDAIIPNTPVHAT